MKNKTRYYSNPEPASFYEMLRNYRDAEPEQTAFQTLDRKMNITEISISEFYDSVLNLAIWMNQTLNETEKIILSAADDYRWVLVFFAAMVSGHPVITLNRDLPAEEMIAMNRKAEGTFLIYDPDYPELAETFAGIRSLPISELESQTEELRKQIPEEEWQNLKAGLEEEKPSLDEAAIFFTSGTTGEAKGVILSEENILEDIHASCQLYKPEGGVLSVLPFYHSFGLVTGVMMPFNYHVPVAFCPSLRRMDKSIKAVRPQTMFMVPLMVETLHKKIIRSMKDQGSLVKAQKAMKAAAILKKIGIDMGKKWFAPIHEQLGGNLDVIICGGAFLEQKYIDDFDAWGISILNGYGITECSPVVAVNRSVSEKRGSVGQMIPGMDYRISEAGELMLKGPTVMQGYVSEPEETALVLDSDGWFNTQDLGHVDKDRFIFLDGRSKNLIILANGENISPEQIEGALSTKSGVGEVVVFSENGRIIAWIYPDPDDPKPEEYYQKLISDYNRDVPVQRRISSLRLRDKPFEKTATRKIKRTGL